MGTASRPRPTRLAEKLLQIRVALGLSQNGMARRLGAADTLSQDTISAYERGVRAPPLAGLPRYAARAHRSTGALRSSAPSSKSDLKAPRSIYLLRAFLPMAARSIKRGNGAIVARSLLGKACFNGATLCRAWKKEGVVAQGWA